MESGAAGERDSLEDEEGNVGRPTCPITDGLGEAPLQTHPMREFEQHLNDLKKENFSLKLRIYFLEERIQLQFEESSDHIYRTNIELKVEVESLKQELQEKQQELETALATAESLTNHNEADVQRRSRERQMEIQHTQQLDTHTQQEAQLVRDRAECVVSVSESPSLHPSVTMETGGDPCTQPYADTDADRLERLRVALGCQERVVLQLTEERTHLRQRLVQMEAELQHLSTCLLQKERDAQFYQEELERERIHVQQEMQSLVEQQYEDAAGQCVSEQQVETLQTQITHSQNSNQELQQKLCELESELLSIRQTSQEQENTIQTLTHTLSTKDTQTQELYNVIEGQNKTLCKLRESQRLQPTQAPADAPDPVLQGSAVSCDLEETRCALTLTQRRLQDLQRERERLQTELQNTLQHRESAHTHTQDLRQAVEQLRSELQVKVCELRDREVQAQTHIADRDRTIAQLQQSLSRKDKQLQEYSELLNPSSDSSGVVDRDTLLQTLRRRIRERDRALESSIDERFRCVEQQEAEVRRLQLVLREKDRDLERLSSVLQSNNHTLTGLDAVLRSKDLELQGALEACRRLEFLKQQSEEKHTLAVRERDGIIKRLQTALHTHTTHTEELQVAGGQGSAGLLLKLSEAERLLQEVMSERSRQLQEHQRQISDLLEALSCRDQELQAYGERMGRLISERSDQLQDLRSLLNTHQQQLNTAHRERDTHTAQLKEKDTLIQELLQVQRHTLIPTAAADGVCMSSSTDLEIQTVRDELQLSLRKHRETERELSDLRALLPAGHHDTVSFNQQQLVSQQQKLNEVLRAEEDLQQSHSDSSHHSGVQEECVLRARGTLLMLEPDDTGGETRQTDANANSADLC
uniref:uncharacterized protein LOC100333916 isoform 6 n=1 Tax=Danio rerio TaxID=7955 RepID=UPI00403CDEB0